MKYFLDTEFIEGTQKSIFNNKPTIDLISIGIVCEDGREYYAISKDFNLKEAWNRWQQRTGQGDYNNINPKEYWLRENVLKPIYDELIKNEIDNYTGFTDPYYELELDFTYRNFKRLIKKYGKTNKQIAEEIKAFTLQRFIGLKFDDEEISGPKFYGYYSDYDWVVFCWLFGKMIDLPKGFPMYCIDLKQILDEMPDRPKHTIFGYRTVEDIKSDVDYPKQTNEHNALADAKWTYELYKFLNTL